MYRIKYKCLNCGKCFYFYGIVADAMRIYWVSSVILRRDGYVQAPMMNDILNVQTKCCESPDIGLSLS